MPGKLDEADRRYLQRAIGISRRALEDQGTTPFGAVAVVGDPGCGEGTSRVVELRDPAAHAEVMARREAGATLGRHLFEDGVMHASSQPCPMCLAACYWARIPRLVYAATSRHAAYGFEDRQFYRDLTHPNDERSLQEDAADDELREAAAAALRAWARQLPVPVAAKY